MWIPAIVRPPRLASRDALPRLRDEFDDTVCLTEPFPFHVIGLHCVDFHRVSDDEVLAALNVATPSPPA